MAPVRFLRAFSLALAPALLALAASAQTTVWTGAANTTWDNPSNWDNGVPTATVDAVIAPATNQPSNYIVDPECRNLTIQSLAILTLGGGFDLTSSGDITITGTFDVTSSSSDVVVAGDWVNDGTYANGSGSVEFTSTGDLSGTSSSTFEELVISGGTRTAVQDFSVSGDVTVESGVSLVLNGTMYTVGGNWTSSAAGISITGTGTIEFTGNGVLTTGSNSVPNVLISAGVRNLNQSSISGDLDLTGGQLQILDNATLSVGGNADLSTGTLGFTSSFAGNEVLDVDGDCTITATAGTFSSESVIRCGGDWSSNASFAPAAGTIELDEGTAQIISGTSPAFVNLRVVSGTKTLTTGLTISADLNIDSGAVFTSNAIVDVNGKVVLGGPAATWNVGSSTHTVAGNWSSSGGSAAGAGTLHFDGPGGLVTGGGSVPNVLISAGTRSALDTNIDGDLTMTGGELSIFDDQTVTVTGNCSLTAGTLTFNDTLGGNEVLDVDGDVTLTALSGGTSANTIIRCGGTWSSTSAFTPAAGLVEFDGGVTANIGGTTPAFPNVQITSGTRTFTAASTLSGGLTVSSGAALATTAPLDIDGGVTLGDGTASWDIGAVAHTVGGAWTSSGASATGAGSIEFDAAGGGIATGGGAVSNVIISSGTYALQSSTITGDLTMTAGTVAVQDNQTLAVLGNALITGGTLSFTNVSAGNELLDVEGDLTLTAVNGGTSAETLVRCAGNYSTSAAYAPTSGQFELDGGTTTTFGGAGISFPNLTVVSGTKTLTDACAVAGDVEVLAGALLDTDAGLDVAGKIVLGDATAAWDVGAVNHTVAGNFTSGGASATGAGTIEFDGPGGLITGGGTITNVLVSAGDRSVLNSDIVGDLDMTGGGLVLFDNQTLTVSGNANLSAGTLTFQDSTAGDEIFDVAGDMTLNASNGGTTDASILRVGGNWSSTGWSPTAGIVELDSGTTTTVGGAPIFHDLQIVSGVKQVLAATSVEGDLGIGALTTLDADAGIDVDGDVSMTATSFWDLGVDTHQIQGDYVSAGGSATGTGTLEFDGTGIFQTGGGTAPSVLNTNGFRLFNTVSLTGNLTMTGGGITVADNQTIGVAGNVVLSGGELTFADSTAGAETLDIAGDATFACSAGAHNANTLIQCAGNWSAVSVYAPTGGLVQLDGGTSTTLGGADPTFYNLEITSGIKNATADVVVANDLAVLDGATLDADAAFDIDGQVVLGNATATWDVGASTHTVAGSWTSSGCSAIGAGTIEFDGPGTLLPTSGTLPSVLISAGDRTCFGTDITGDLSLTGGNMRIENDRAVDVAGNANLTGGTLTWLGDGLGGQEGLDVEGNATVQSTVGGETVDAVFFCAGDWSSDTAFAPALGTVELDGAGSTTIGGTGTTLANLVITGGTKTLLSDALVGADLTVANSTAVVSNAAWDIDGDVSVGDGTSSFDLGTDIHTVAGDWLSTGASASGAGTLRFDGTGILATNPGTVSNVDNNAGFRLIQNSTVTGNMSMSIGGVTVADNQTLAVLGNLSFTGGTLTFIDSTAGLELIDVEGNVHLEATAGGHSANSRIHCAGNWSGNSSYSPGSGTVVLDGAGATTISAGGATTDPTFNRLTLTAGPRSAGNNMTLTASQLTIEASSSFDVGSAVVAMPSGSLTVDGGLSVGAGGNLKLGSTSAVTIMLGASLQVVGALGNPAVIDGHLGGGYLLNIDGTLSAQHFTFGDMGPSGIIVNNGATIAAAPNDMRTGLFTGPSASANSAMLDVRRPAPTEFRFVDFEDPGGVGTFNVKVLGGSPITFINSDGNFAGDGFEQDPFNLIDWDEEGTVLTAFLVTPGADQMTIDWTTSVEVDVANFLIERATAFAGPFSPIATPAATGAGSYQYVDLTVAAGQLYVYRLSEVLSSGPTQLLDEGFGKPWGSAPPPNFLTVGPGGAFADVQTALAAAGGVTNPVVSIEPGTYAPFTVTPVGPAGTIRITGDGTGLVVIDTTAAPVEVLNMGFFNNVEIGDMEIGNGISGNVGLRVQNCLGVVIVDGVTVHGGGIGLAGVEVDNCLSVALQKCTIDGESGLVVQNSSNVVASLGSLDDLEVLSGSTVRTAELPIAPPIVDPGATFTAFAGAAADIEMPRLVSIGDGFSMDLAGEPNGIFLMLLSSDFLWLDIAADADMVGLSNLIPGTVLFNGAFPGSGAISLPQTLPESGAFYGFPLIFQTIVVDIVTLRPRWSSVATLIGTH